MYALACRISNLNKKKDHYRPRKTIMILWKEIDIKNTYV